MLSSHDKRDLAIILIMVKDTKVILDLMFQIFYGLVD